MAGFIRTIDQSAGGLDLNSILKGGGSVSLPALALGGLGGTSGFNLNNIQPTTTDTTVKKNTDTTRTGAESTKTTGVANTASTTDINKKLLDEKSLAILQDVISRLAQGQGNPLLNQIDTAKGTGITGVQQLIAGQDPNAAVQRAGGRVADLTRQLNEGAIATLLGSQEAGGFGGNALSQLLAQDAAVRTGEAAARVEEDAYNQAIENQLAGTQTLNQLLQGGSSVQEALIQALNTLKGATETGTERTRGTTTTSEISDRATTGQESVRGTDKGSSSVIDPVEWIKAFGNISLAGGAGGGNTGPTAMEKALALFPAIGGNTNALLASLDPSARALYAGSGGSTAAAGAQGQLNALVRMIRGY